MAQVLATIFFTAAALSALGVIVAMIGDNLADVRRALGFIPAPRPSTRRVRMRRANPTRSANALRNAGLRMTAAA